jgi:hypothetical protein
MAVSLDRLVACKSKPTADRFCEYRLLLIYLCILVVFIPFIWLVCPETKGKSLEEIGTIFGDRHVRGTLNGALGEKGQEQEREGKDVSQIHHAHIEN